MPIEERDDLLRMPAEVVVAVLEAPRARDLEQLLLVAGEQVEGLLGVHGIARPRVVAQLNISTTILTPSIARGYLRVREDRQYRLPQLPFTRRVPNAPFASQKAASMPSAGIVS